VYELPLGLRLGELLDWAGGPAAQLSAVLVGGYFGSWLPIDRARAARLLEAHLRGHGSLGARALHALPRSTCGIAESARVLRYLAEQSAGQCGPCVHGLAAVATALEHLALGKPVPGQGPDRIKHWLRQIDGRGACRNPDGAVTFARSALSVFADELESHADGRCSAPESLSVIPLLRA
jgi:NADH:ubiquinone oxidoreductase subunit F (NADH-binding)